MAELTLKERLQPALLDRLADDFPERHDEPRELRSLTLKQFRQSVLRDLAWLLNADNMSYSDALNEHPEAASSVINYGIPSLTGKTVSNTDVEQLEMLLRKAIRDFEPRILEDSLRVRIDVSDTQTRRSAIAFYIEGDLWAQPAPEHLYIKTEFDLETGHVSVAGVDAWEST